jgi:hypothetical protein
MLDIALALYFFPDCDSFTRGSLVGASAHACTQGYIACFKKIFKRTRLKRVPVISREHFRKTRTSSNNCYFKYQLLLQIPIVTSNTNCYFKYQLLLQIPIVTSNTNWYFKYQLAELFGRPSPSPSPWTSLKSESENGL